MTNVLQHDALTLGELKCKLVDSLKKTGVVDKLKVLSLLTHTLKLTLKLVATPGPSRVGP